MDEGLTLTLTPFFLQTISHSTNFNSQHHPFAVSLFNVKNKNEKIENKSFH
jgi:hypothetical protein